MFKMKIKSSKLKRKSDRNFYPNRRNSMSRLITRKMLIWIVTLAIGLSTAQAGQRKTGEVAYLLNFLSALDSCKQTTNKVLDMSGLSLQQDSSTTTSVTGEIIVRTPIEAGTEVILTVYKNLESSLEFFYMVQGDLCEHIGDLDMPWTVLFNAMEISSCPIQAKRYFIEKLSLNLDYAKEVMKHEFVGEYNTTMTMQKVGEGLDVVPKQISCHQIATSVMETKVE